MSSSMLPRLRCKLRPLTNSICQGHDATRRLCTTSYPLKSLSRIQRLQSVQRESRRRKASSAIDFTQSSTSTQATTSAGSLCAAEATSPSNHPDAGRAVPTPTRQALRTLFVASACPMIGFGMTDQIVLILAGQWMDATLGVAFGLAVLTSAAAGQVVSDVSGVLLGGTLERVMLKLSLIETPDLSTAQRNLSVCRNVSMAGAVCGVIIGCALGATTLLFVDLEKRNRIERAQQLRAIVGDMITLEDDGAGAHDEEGGSLQAESCCIYVTNADDFQVEGNPGQHQGRICLKHLSPTADASTVPMVRECGARSNVMLSPDRSMLFLPIREDDQLLAVLELRRRLPLPVPSDPPRTMPEEGTDAATQSVRHRGPAYTDADVRTAKVLAKHLGIFMNRLVE